MNPERVILETDVQYPETDGEPMAETDLHAQRMIDLRLMLEERYRDRKDVYVSGNLLLYYVEGDISRSLAPDVFVVMGVAGKLRRVYKLWEEGKGPDFVIEVTSRSTRTEDVGKKRELYRDRLGVKEYFLFDPEGDYLLPRLKGIRFREGKEEEIPEERGRLHSEQLGLHLEAQGSNLVLFDSATGERLIPPGELPELRREAERRAERAEGRAERAEGRAAGEAEERRKAEAEVQRLQEEIRRLRGETPGR